MRRRLMCVFAHPDDESLGTGGALAKYAAEGVETYLLTATRGERGRFGDNHDRPGDDVVGRTREAELRAAASELGVRDVTVLGYPDGGLDSVPTEIAQQAITEHLYRIRPHVVVTFGPDGAYGHPDHIAISQLTREFDASSTGRPQEPHHSNRHRRGGVPSRGPRSRQPDRQLARPDAQRFGDA